MLQIVKQAVRVSDSAFDDEIADLIDSARQDLIISGVARSKAKPQPLAEEDPLIKRAIILYAKANYGLDSPNAERFAESYYLLKQHLSLAGDYREPLV